MVIIVGAGEVGKGILKKYYSNLKDCVFYDNDRRKWGTSIEGRKIITLTEFIEYAKNLESEIVVASKSASLHAFLKDVAPACSIYLETNNVLKKIELEDLKKFDYINATEVGISNLQKHIERAKQLKESGDFLAYEHAMRYIDFKKEHLKLPEISSIEFTNNCNLKCPNCPNATLSFHKGFISDDVFYEALKYVPPYQKDTVAVHCMGEPLLHPKLIEYLTAMSKRKINICISTNGLLLTEELGRKILDIFSSLDRTVLYISFHVKKSVENWLKFTKLVEAYKIEGLDFYGQVLEHNEEEAHAWLKELGIENPHEHPYIRHITSHSWGGNVEGRKVEYSDIEVNNRIRVCYYLRNRKVAVMWDGQLRGCCYDSNATQKCGNIFDFANADIDPYGYELCRCCDPDWLTGYQ